MMYTEPAWKVSALSLQSTCETLRGKLESSRDRLEGLHKESAHNKRQHKVLLKAQCLHYNNDAQNITERCVCLKVPPLCPVASLRPSFSLAAELQNASRAD